MTDAKTRLVDILQPEDGKEVATRGMASLTAAQQLSNFCMVFGTNPAKMVKLETKMIKNIIDHIQFCQDKVKKSVEFPGTLEQIKADDANFELSVSNTIERLTLYNRSSIYRSNYTNIVKKCVGIVFVNSQCKTLQY